MKAFEYQPKFNKTCLPNGVRVVTEHHPYTRASSASIYANIGTRHEPNHLLGAAHFIEHMVFKGTSSRNAFELAKSLEEVGGDLNAYTTREHTCFHTSSLKEHLSLSLDVLTDLVTDAVFDSEEFEKERQVILHEIDMSADLLEEWIFDLYFEHAYQGHSLGRSILGTPDSLKGIGRDQLFQYYKSYYRGANLLVSVAGDVDHKQVVDLVQERLSMAIQVEPTIELQSPNVQSFKKVIRRSSEQVHILMGVPSSAFTDEFRFEGFIVNALLCGGMTSNLYQKVREERGLAYSIYSYLTSFLDSGLIMVYAGTTEANYLKVLGLIWDEYKQIKTNGISEEQLELFKRQVIGNVVLGADDIENRMNSLAVNEMVFGRYRSVDSVVEEIEKISVQDIGNYLERYFNWDKMGLLVLGDLDPEEALKSIDQVIVK